MLSNQQTNYAPSITLFTSSCYVEMPVCRDGSNVYECGLCNVMVTSQDQLNTHLRGLKHQNKMKQASGENLNRKGRGRGMGPFIRSRAAQRGARGQRLNFLVLVVFLCNLLIVPVYLLFSRECIDLMERIQGGIIAIIRCSALRVSHKK